MSLLCPKCGHLLYPDRLNLKLVCFCGYSDAVDAAQISHPILTRKLALVGPCFIPPRSILVATYGTLKRERAYALPTERGTFIGIDRIPNGQLYVNKEQRVWPIIVPGTCSVECDLYLVDGMNFNWLRTGEETNGYLTKLTVLQSGQEAYVWWYQVADERWEAVEKY